MGLNNQWSADQFKRLGTELTFRAPEQHARLVESRNSVLRHVMHIIEEDLRSIGQEIPFTRLHAEAFFVVNAFSFYNGVSPYNALTGRQPPFLLDLENVNFPEQ
eukprot:8576676-Karenia_brevis.AAC.1